MDPFPKLKLAERNEQSMKILIIDNYDSFVYNLSQYVGELGHEPIIFRNDRIDITQVRKLAPDRVIISPGPGNPSEKKDFGVNPLIIRELGTRTPVLGVCLGHQGIATSLGGRVVRASTIMHGKVSEIRHDGRSIFNGIRNPLKATRYHSLVVDKNYLPSSFIISAWSSEDNQIMGIRHKFYPLEGVQFHPESFCTQDGHQMIKNFIELGVQN